MFKYTLPKKIDLTVLFGMLSNAIHAILCDYFIRVAYLLLELSMMPATICLKYIIPT